MLMKLLHRLEEIHDTVNENNDTLAELAAKRTAIIRENNQLENEAEKIKEQIAQKGLIKINVVDLFEELQEILSNYEGIYEVEQVLFSSGSQLDSSDLKTFKQRIKEENRTLRVWFQFVSFSGTRTHDFKLTIPIKDITLTNGEKLLNQLELKDNQVIITPQIQDMILVNIDLNDEMMQNSIFNKAVMNYVAKIEQTQQKN